MPVEDVFGGLLDEIRIANIQRSANWVKLCYMNQRVDDKLVVFKYNMFNRFILNLKIVDGS